MWGLSKPNVSKWPKPEASYSQRMLSFLLRELVPTLLIVIILSICTSLVAEKIYQAKASKAETLSMLERVSQSSPR